MHIKSNYKKLLIWISLVVCTQTKAQTSQELLHFANQCYANANYSLAVKSYTRLLFFEKEKFGNQCYSTLANAYYKLGDFSQAINYYDMAYNSTRVDSAKTEATFNKTLCFMMLKNYDYALIEMYGLPDSLSASNLFRKNLFEASIFFMKEDYAKAQAIFEAIYPANYSYKAAFDKLYDKFLHENKFSVHRAKMFSYFIPGLGQAYSGDAKNSINSFLLTIGFVTLYLTVATTVSPLEAIIGVGPWFQRYYQGGVKHAGLIAEKKKEKIKSKNYISIVDFVKNWKD